MGITLQYGSYATSPEEAAAPLRAAAVVNGIKLKPASKLDLVAAAYSAEQWCLAHRTRSLEFPGVHGHQAVQALAAVIARASGRRTDGGKRVPALPQDGVWEELTAELNERERYEVACRVVGDLSYGGSPVLSDWVTLRLGQPGAAGEEPAEAS